MCHPLFEWLCLAPFCVHMMWEEIAGLARMNYYIRFGDCTAKGLPATIHIKFFEILFYKHDRGPARLFNDSIVPGLANDSS
jgi:hypothetical protein